MIWGSSTSREWWAMRSFPDQTVFSSHQRSPIGECRFQANSSPPPPHSLTVWTSQTGNAMATTILFVFSDSQCLWSADHGNYGAMKNKAKLSGWLIFYEISKNLQCVRWLTKMRGKRFSYYPAVSKPFQRSIVEISSRVPAICPVVGC